MSTLVQHIQSASNLSFGVGIIILLLFTALFLTRIFPQLQKTRLLTSTPRSKIRSAAQGYTGLTGTIKPLWNEQIAPLSGKNCCWYRYCIESKIISYDSRGNRQEKWVLITEQVSAYWFILADDTGECIIIPTQAEISSITKEQWYNNRVPDSFFKASEFDQTLNFLKYKDEYRFSEMRLQTGDPLNALGMFQTFSLETDVFAPEQLLSPKKAENLQKLKAWNAKHSILSVKTQGLVDISMMQQQWETLRAKNISKETTVNLMSMLQLGDRPYLLSSLPLKRLIWRYRFSTLIHVIGFLFCGGLAVAMITIRLMGQ